ncbi:phosphoenolpyruvate--protein phosphotransferase [Actinoplanes bogorensis]|uniref:Phosphocarrier protein HPr n=1 Tax=Paractinoplanes bogorensis TaxID=1610840 RepID=A0ABS5YKX2_9ACTN|nr:phosphoenolpyruvate--protein phosphotransferase [Actinoplanes bogorensis]MBU2664082.1 phosphoenolpyruvate--protein phosphotransferase [Actinoplanes bogorensis]
MTVGLVVVCHSRPLARAAAALASEMTPGVTVEVAAGLDETTFGTDAVAISEALVAADSGDGVVVLMDLGSAVLSAETALEFLDDDQRARVLLCPAPLVEGLVAAVVTAASGASRAEVAAEAMSGLAGKQSHFGASVQDPVPSGTESGAPDAVVTVTNPHGLHARPAARLVGAMRVFDARVELRNVTTDSAWVSASSLTRVATLGALQGHELAVRASGAQAQAAVDGFVALAAGAFGEATPGVAIGPSRGSGSSPGVAIGPAMRLHEPKLDIPDEPSQGAEAELARLDEAMQATRQEISQIPGEIFEAHLLLLDDDELLGGARARIERGATAPAAWQAATDAVAGEFDALDDPYLRGRAADVRAVGAQVLRELLGVTASTVPVTADGVVLIAADLTPAEAAGLDPARIEGVVLAGGSPTSHAAILTRTRGIPAVVGAGPHVLEVAEGTLVAMDGGTGEVEADPPAERLAELRARAAAQAVARDQARALASRPAVTRDGVTVEVGANVGSVDEARTAAANGADLAGLVRTEFLFLDRDRAPDADEQESVYLRIAEALGGRRITLRTLDAGSDKPLPYLPAPGEANPFLGVRGIRHSLAHRAMFAEQLRAIVRVARRTPVSIMFPMVTVVGELLEARRMLDEAIGGETPDGLLVGMMVEVPAAALRARDFVPYVDFFSIGTNDLTQYTLAAERGNADLRALTEGLDPAVEQLIRAVGEAAGERVVVSVCGELAAASAVVPRLLAAGVRELSVAPSLVPDVKQTVRDA